MPREQLFPNRRPLSYPNLTKTMKTYIRFKQHKNSTPKIEPQQKYRLGTISNIELLVGGDLQKACFMEKHQGQPRMYKTVSLYKTVNAEAVLTCTYNLCFEQK